MSEAITTADLLQAIRDRLVAEVADVTVSRRLGEPPSAAARHKYIEIVSVESSEPLDGDPAQVYIKNERRIRLRWSYAIRSDVTDSDPLTFARQIQQALCGSHTAFAHRYDIFYAGEPIALGRDGGYYTGELDIMSRRAQPTGS